MGTVYNPSHQHAAQLVTGFRCQPRGPKSILTRRSGCWGSGLFQRAPTSNADVPALAWVCAHPHSSVHPYQEQHPQPCSPRFLLMRPSQPCSTDCPCCSLVLTVKVLGIHEIVLISFLELEDTCRLLLTATTVVFM